MTEIMKNHQNDLLFLAGKRALAQIRENGLAQSDIRVLAGASGAAKWLVLSSIDRALMGTFFSGRTEPLFAVGTSIGAWRFAALGRKDPVKAISFLEHGYISQKYEGKPTAQDVTDEGWRILSGLLDDNGPSDILSHPFLRLCILAVKTRGLLKSEEKLPLGIGLLQAATANLIKRERMGRYLSRAMFFDKRDRPPFFHMNGFPITHIPLAPDNLSMAVLASGSIPLAMKGVTDIPGAPKGMYRDGGIIDYHPDIPFLDSGSRELTLFPHFIPKIVPGWFDKHLKWRKPGAANMDSVLLVCPSPEFVSRLPYGKIPDRNDFKTFFGDDDTRMAYWWDVVDKCRHLGDLFLETAASGRIRDMVKPLSAA